jgi:hypothetical protein
MALYTPLGVFLGLEPLSGVDLGEITVIVVLTDLYTGKMGCAGTMPPNPAGRRSYAGALTCDLSRSWSESCLETAVAVGID